MKEEQRFISIEDFLAKKNVDYNDVLVISIKKYLNSKISKDGLTKSLKSGDEYFTRFLETEQVRKKLRDIIKQNIVLVKKHNL